MSFSARSASAISPGDDVGVDVERVRRRVGGRRARPPGRSRAIASMTRGLTPTTSPTRPRVDVAACACGRRRARRPCRRGRPAGAPCRLSSAHDLLVDLADEHLLDDVHRRRIGDAHAAHELRRDAGLLARRRRSTGPPPCTITGLHADVLEERDVLRERVLELVVLHRVPAVLDDEHLAGEALDERQRLDQHVGLLDGCHQRSYAAQAPPAQPVDVQPTGRASSGRTPATARRRLRPARRAARTSLPPRPDALHAAGDRRRRLGRTRSNARCVPREDGTYCQVISIAPGSWRGREMTRRHASPGATGGCSLVEVDGTASLAQQELQVCAARARRRRLPRLRQRLGRRPSRQRRGVSRMDRGRRGGGRSGAAPQASQDGRRRRTRSRTRPRLRP